MRFLYMFDLMFRPYWDKNHPYFKFNNFRFLNDILVFLFGYMVISISERPLISLITIFFYFIISMSIISFLFFTFNKKEYMKWLKIKVKRKQIHQSDSSEKLRLIEEYQELIKT